MKSFATVVDALTQEIVVVELNDENIEINELPHKQLPMEPGLT